MKKRRIILWLSIVAIASMMFSGVEQSGAVATRAVVVPPISVAGPGESFTIDIDVFDVDSAHSLYSFYMNLSWDPDVLTITNLIEGDFLEEQPEGTDPWARVEAEDGWAYFGWSTHGPYDGVHGDGTLCSVEFTVNVLGESPLNINNPQTELIEMRAIGGGHVPETIVADFEDGFFTNLAGLPPVASFTHSPERPSIGEEVSFDASASSDPDGFIVRYEWDFGDGTTKIYVEDVNLTAITTHTYTSSGSKSVMLTVVDNSTMEVSETKFLSIRFEHDIAVTAVTVSTNTVAPGDSVSISATVENVGSSTETFTVVFTYDGQTIGQEAVSDLAPDGEKTVNISWDTSGVAEGTYSIRATASGVTGDGNTENNERFGGNVEVRAAAGFPMEYIAIAVVVIIVIAIGVFAYSRRKS